MKCPIHLNLRTVELTSLGDVWGLLDPLNLSAFSARINQTMDEILCDTPKICNDAGCPCTLMQFHYGPGLFKCPVLGCAAFRQGFASKKARNSHATQHERSWRCAIPACYYATTGFLSKKMRDEHFDSDHRPQTQSTGRLLGTDLPAEGSVLADLIWSNDEEAVGDFLSRYKHSRRKHGYRPNDKDFWREIYIVAAQSASVNILNKLIEFNDDRMSSAGPDMVDAAFDGGDSDCIEWTIRAVIGRGGNDLIRRCIVRLLEHEEPETVICLAEDALKGVSSNESWRDQGLLSRDCLVATIGHPDREDNLIRLWKAVGRKVPRERHEHRYYSRLWEENKLARKRRSTKKDPATDAKVLQERRTVPTIDKSLKAVARITMSIPLARKILDNGVNVNGFWPSHPNRLTPLQAACRKSSASDKAPKFVHFLLHHGADPETFYENIHLRTPIKTHVRDEKVPQNLPQTLGMTWEELIQKVKDDREAGLPWEEV